MNSPVVTALILAAVLLAAALPQQGSRKAGAATPVAATPLPASSTPQATATEPLPPTPGPDTPTPALPEEGGPPGGVLGGHLFEDVDGNGARSAGDLPVAGEQIHVNRLPRDSSDVGPTDFFTNAGLDGYWEVRGLPDGRYRVSWAPPLRDPADLARSIPPPTDIVLDPEHTVQLPNRIVEIVKANRILNIDFGMPHQNPIPGGAQPRLPNTGAGDGGAVSANEIVLFAALAASAVSALGLAVGRRKNARRGVDPTETQT